MKEDIPVVKKAKVVKKVKGTSSGKDNDDPATPMTESESGVIPLREIEYKQLQEKYNRLLLEYERLKSGAGNSEEAHKRIDSLEIKVQEVQGRVASFDEKTAALSKDLSKIMTTLSDMENTVKELAAVLSTLARQNPYLFEAIRQERKKKEKKE
ncbi:MAG: hypothetical protein QW728_03380 [Thermoplasmata archaeon]